MPQNPNLFPDNYTDLCPRTDVPEDDGLDEILRMLTALRHQHLLAARRSGQSIAELQNQSLIVLDCCTPTIIPPPPVVNPFPTYNPPPPIVTPPPIARKIYFGGGEYHGIHGQVDKFTPDTNQVASLGFTFTTRRMRHSTISSSAKGYWFGGETDGAVKLSSVEAVNFNPESKATVSTGMTSASAYARGASGESKGYNVGADSGNTKRFDIFTYSTEVSAAGGTMPAASGGCNAGQSAVKAYFCAGVNQTERTFDNIPFSTDTPAAMSALLSVARRRGVGMSSDSKFYIGGGISTTAGYQDGFEALTFSTETTANVNAKLAIATDDIEGMGLGVSGITSQGYIERSAHHLQRFSFAQEICQEIDATLSRGGRYSSVVGKV